MVDLGGGPFADGRDAAGDVMAYARSLEATNARLKRVNVELDELTRLIAHDLRAPVRAVSQIQEILAEEVGGDASELVVHLGSAIERLEALLEGLLALGRVDARPEALEPVDLAAVVDGLRHGLGSELSRRRAAIVTPDPLPTILARPSVDLLFANLIQNAVRHSGDEPGLRIEVGARRLTNHWEVSVEDSGPGIPEREREVVFRLYYARGKIRRDGRGVGLAICARVARNHGASLRVGDSRLGGARFVVRWPHQPAAFGA